MTHRVGFVVFDGVTMLDVSGPAEVLHQAGLIGHPYELVLVSASGGQVTTSTGMPLSGVVTAAEAAGSTRRSWPRGDLLAERPLDADLLATARAGGRRRHAGRLGVHGRVRAGRARVLDGRRATTHWRHADALARRHPPWCGSSLDAIHVRDGRLITSAGISAGIDLTAGLWSRTVTTGPRRPGFAPPRASWLSGSSAAAAGRSVAVHRGCSRLPARHDLLRVGIDSAPADPADMTTACRLMAGAAGASTRHLTRLFHTELGTTPARWAEWVRVEHAQRLLLDGHSVTAAARDNGLSSAR